ncbi:hypothetical protein WJX82_004098 [Trebouxia sp. C0006]
MYDYIAQFSFAAICLFIPSVPVTHCLGLVAHSPRSAKLKYLLLYPVKGGRHHFIFQIISWGIWVASIFVALPLLLHTHKAIRAAHVEILSGSAATGAVFAELFMIKSLLVFNPKAKATDDESSSPRWNTSRLPSKGAASAAVMGLGLVWAALGGSLLLATEYLQDTVSKEVYFFLAACCLLVGATTTHGLGGSLRHKQTGPFTMELGADVDPRQPDPVTTWKFYQPFRGGAWFVATQAMGWALFSISIVCLCWLLLQVVAGVAYCIRCWALITGSVMFCAQLFLGMSIWTWKEGSVAQGVAQTVRQVVTNPAQEAVSWSAVWLPILMMYSPVQVVCTVFSLSFMLLPASFAAALWVGGLAVYYAVTLPGAPEHTGRRESALIQKWCHKHMETALKAWFGNVEVVREGTTPFDPQDKFIFGYAPHGLFPIGAGFLPYIPTWGKLLPGIVPATLVASILFFTPLVRDLVSWCGLRQVSRRTFVCALQDKGSVMLVPGGQAELVHTWRIKRRQEYVVYSGHKGFVRMGIEHNAKLVPVVVMGEINALQNPIDLPGLQRWTYKNLGFPVPYWVVGRWGVSPFPKRAGLKFIIGEPICPRPHVPGTKVDEAEVDRLHKIFYDKVAELFTQHKDSFQGYERVKLIMI